jgi:uncharacterized protein YqjF (DUF2071 family)
MELINPYPPHSIARPVMLQTWRSLTFLHWPYEPSVVRNLLPPGLELDTFDGAAWVGLAPFLLANLRPPFLPALPWISWFPETNVRTYVRGPDGVRGVWFFTLEADRLAAVIGARTLYRLPYRWARMKVVEQDGMVTYTSKRLPPFGEAASLVGIRPGAPLIAGQLDHFLTARFRLYTVARNRIAHADIEHEPWPLHCAEVTTLEQNLFEQSGVPQPVGSPVLHFSPALDVRIGRFQIA